MQLAGRHGACPGFEMCNMCCPLGEKGCQHGNRVVQGASPSPALLGLSATPFQRYLKKKIN